MDMSILVELFLEGFKMYPSYCIGSGMLWLCIRHDVDVEFPMWVNSKTAIKGIIKILKHVKQVILLRFAKVGELFDNIIHIHLFILGVQDCGSKAVWIVPVSAKDCFLLMVYFKGFNHSEIGSHMGNLQLNHFMVLELCLILMLLFVRKSAITIEPKCFMLLNDPSLSNSGNCIANRTTVWLSVHHPASVLTLWVLVTGHGLQCLGRPLRGMSMAINPESKTLSTGSNIVLLSWCCTP